MIIMMMIIENTLAVGFSFLARRLRWAVFGPSRKLWRVYFLRPGNCDVFLWPGDCDFFLRPGNCDGFFHEVWKYVTGFFSAKKLRRVFFHEVWKYVTGFFSCPENCDGVFFFTRQITTGFLKPSHNFHVSLPKWINISKLPRFRNCDAVFENPITIL